MRGKTLTTLVLVAGACLFGRPLSAGHAADIYGTIRFQGAPPPEVEIPQLKADANCGQFHKEMPTTHFYVVGPKGGFADVIVSLKGVHEKRVEQKPTPLVIDQKGCEYRPYVSACQTGQEIIVKNSDPVLHNVHVTPRQQGNREMNQAQLPRGPDLEFSFNTPEQFLRFKCDVHPWMFAYVSVFDHPWFDVSGKDGSYRIHNVPPGDYIVEARHRKLGAEEHAVEVKDHDVKLDFHFHGSPSGPVVTDRS